MYINGRMKMGNSKNFSLALSGGGFRASLFHLGALMKLSETGLLKRTTTISTVSGGSIIGVLYYLHLKYLLETKENVKDEDLLEVVNSVKNEFWEAMKKNIVMEPIKKDFFKLIEAGINPDYSRTNILAKTYQEEIYNNIWKKIVNYWKSQKNRPEEWKDIEKDENPYLYRLKIYPKAIFRNERKDFENFKIEEYNNNYPVKIPDLIINATNLNTGNLWRFSATKFGEYLSINDVFQNKKLKKLFFQKCNEKEIYKLRGKYGIEKMLEILTDEKKLKNFYETYNIKSQFETLEKFKNALEEFFKELNKFIECHMYHFFKKETCNEELNEQQKKSITVGDAVASSACVPGIFSPYVFKEKEFGKYKKIYNLDKLLLVDGGVYDNQGLESIERKITKYKIKEKRDKKIGLVFCSDGSGQMNIEELKTKAIDAVKRSSNVMGKRLRNLTINKLYYEKNRGSLKFVLIHLKQSVNKPIDNLHPPLTFDEELAELNSRLRTQLNRFWDEEIKSLISHGYILSEYFLYKFFEDEINEISNDFRKEVVDYIKRINENKDEFKKVLKLGQHEFSTVIIALYKKFGIG
jgi:predicted acylesterase/phospholipase RssA